jgi:hypothetical protein
MSTNCDFSRSSLLTEQYQYEMELITAALQDEGQDEHEERLSFVARSWALTSHCFRSQCDSTGPATYASVALVHR